MGSMFKESKKRSLLIGLVWILCLSVIIGRLFWLQTFDHNELLADAEKKWIYDDKLRPKRGTIYDRTREQPLAWEVDAYIFLADPKQVKNPHKTASVLAPILKISESSLYKLLTSSKKSVELKADGHYKYPEPVYDKVMALRKQGQLEGIYAFPTTMRQYNGNEAAHVLGYVNYDDVAVGGVEQYYDRLLRGKEGYIKYLKARNGMMITDKPSKDTPPEPGKDLVLTIDSRIQQQVELELDEAVRNYQAKGGTAIVADPKTGEILAMASRPTFDPNRYAETINDDNRRNRAIESQFEPGSTFKIVTLAAAIEEGVFHPDALYQSGSIRVGDQVIRDWNETGWGRITYRQGIEESSNVAFVRLGQMLGNKLVDYIARFGFGNITDSFGKRTGIDLPAEARGVYYGRNLYPAELATTAFGQGISVTPIQQVAAVSAIANGGILMKPHVLKEEWDSGLSKKVKEYKPEGHRIIKPETAKQVRDLLRDVVAHGTGVEAEIPGYQVAGKTGTAQIPDPEGKGYLKGKYMVSFIGFAPYDHPNLVVYVAIDQPTTPTGSGSGGTVAAPVARNIMKAALQIRHVQPDQSFAESIK
ncbi:MULTISPECIES: penicillin-binding protein 2 [Thermoactinomyces]|jgi:stage V sporulation protein D (sporulation-specific penicillin-binding protein)|uniref:Penicillin-binding protein 2 n=1 Tax=Thermoactinomyces daqus TaxID=1329516 RepID=A0A7W1X9G6_9BACL|nr:MULTISPECIES: penicillin-binding protein 2 [Thermoactinomyces]MBA4542545.1 penicillin-binding protein 2 [Thermoactinomyces daqus]MBH8598055.1 penicillin-binding protein 2 [Thermoactinomyces sp. CICC 10523]MBH8603086.1 penicillin-binding protein 2 [Thermoactinomyces sp. CICC 10522]